jgi:heme a synthase
MAADALTPPADPVHRFLLVTATLLALAVVGLGAYVRLSDAGLGCPDWPGCYGQLLGVPDAGHEVAQAREAFPERPLESGKAWKEMIHRYAAGSLGLLVLGIAVSAWQRRPRIASLENALLALIVVQAALGMWTVTLLLKPVIVSLHLLGGMTTWAILLILLRREIGIFKILPDVPVWLANVKLARWRALAVVMVFLQIALGGWTSSNYAALACAEFPKCLNGQWWPAADFRHAFTLLRELGETASGELLPGTALTAIHLMHRVGALLVCLVVGSYAFRLWRPHRTAAAWILVALALQIGIGIRNVELQLPLQLAVAHNLCAAFLLSLLLLSASPRRQLARNSANDREWEDRPGQSRRS